VVANRPIRTPGTPILSFGEDEPGEVYFLVTTLTGKGIYQFQRRNETGEITNRHESTRIRAFAFIRVDSCRFVDLFCLTGMMPPVTTPREPGGQVVVAAHVGQAHLRPWKKYVTGGGPGPERQDRGMRIVDVDASSTAADHLVRRPMMVPP